MRDNDGTFQIIPVWCDLFCCRVDDREILMDANILFIISLSFIDITLTHYRFFLDRKKKVFEIRDEKGILGRIVMGNDPNPRNYLVGCLISISVFAFVSMFNRDASLMFIGALFIVNFIHITEINKVRRNWNNRGFWNLFKKYRKVRKY